MTMTGITILMPTYGRDSALHQTLEAMARVDRTGIDCDLVIIDNKCSTSTAEVVSGFTGRLPITFLQEPRSGKNCALNKALNECRLKDIVVFTDDDVTPQPDWLQKIAAATARNPDVSIFGGTIEVGWPPNGQPDYLVADWLVRFGCSRHRYSPQEVFYKYPMCPSGANFWVRKSVFERVSRFDETIGPRPKNRITGSETSFLLRLRRQGMEVKHCPEAVVYHRLEPAACEIRTLRRRGYRFGRGNIRLHGWRRENLLKRNRFFWVGVMLADYVYTGGRLGFGALLPSKRRNCEITVDAMMRLGELCETTNQAYQHLRSRLARRPDPEPQALHPEPEVLATQDSSTPASGV